MPLLISDANILMDIEAGDLVAPMFRLDSRFAVPDLLYVEELEGDYTYMCDLGLQVRRGTGRNDLSAPEPYASDRP